MEGGRVALGWNGLLRDILQGLGKIKYTAGSLSFSQASIPSLQPGESGPWGSVLSSRGNSAWPCQLWEQDEKQPRALRNDHVFEIL